MTYRSTPDEVFHDVFKKFDRDNSGSLSYAEFVALMSKLSKHIPELNGIELCHMTAFFHLFEHDNCIVYKDLRNWWLSNDKYRYITKDKRNLLVKAFDLFHRYADRDTLSYRNFSDMMRDLNMECTKEEYNTLAESTDGVIRFSKFCRWLNWFT